MHKRSKFRLLPVVAVAATLLASGCSSTAPPTPEGSATGSTAVTAAPDPAAAITLAPLAEVPTFELTSTDVTTGEQLPLAQESGVFGVPGGGDVSPQLSWSGFPEETRSFVVTMFDPDAPTGSGFWHWAVTDLPVTTTSLPAGAADALPAGARQLSNDAGVAGYIGAAPPAGTGEHRYVITVTALSVPAVDVPDDASPALLGFTIGGSTLARATLVPTAAQED